MGKGRCSSAPRSHSTERPFLGSRLSVKGSTFDRSPGRPDLALWKSNSPFRQVGQSSPLPYTTYNAQQSNDVVGLKLPGTSAMWLYCTVPHRTHVSSNETALSLPDRLHAHPDALWSKKQVLDRASSMVSGTFDYY